MPDVLVIIDLGAFGALRIEDPNFVSVSQRLVGVSLPNS